MLSLSQGVPPARNTYILRGHLAHGPNALFVFIGVGVRAASKQAVICGGGDVTFISIGSAAVKSGSLLFPINKEQGQLMK